jgi:2-aminoadipate transaminase
MVEMLKAYFPADIKYTLPEGGMFLWVTLPENISAMDVFNKATERNVVFVPGAPFYVDGGGKNTLRLNFSNTDATQIEAGMLRLAHALQDVS